jgi:hypothetical protein
MNSILKHFTSDRIVIVLGTMLINAIVIMLLVERTLNNGHPF